jgi:protein TonB
VAPAPAPVTAARFDADYLQNPKPVYPPMSRRMNEEGKVVLRVRVSAQGLPLAVELKQSSNHARLDEAARSAVERWRFVPARQGSEAVEAWVLVPLNFTLSN